MPLEAVVVVLDNSEFNRNGDFAPSRWESQNDAATNICDVKMQQNPENTLGVMSMAGNRVELHITQSREIGDILTAVSNIPINGRANFMTAVKVAQLSLKHRMNKNQKPRVVIFCGHPLEEEQVAYEQLGKRLRQNNVAIDVINFANPDNVPKLQALVDAANKNDNSHFLDVPLGVSMITDVLFTSPILQGEDAFGGAAGAADGTNGMVTDVAAGGAGAGAEGMGQFGAEFANDPELAQALMISMQEQRAKQNEEAKTDAAGADGNAAAADAPVANADAAMAADDDDSHDEDYYIQQAMQLSMQEAADQKPAATEAEGQNNSDAAAEQVDIKDVVNTDFMKDLVNQLDLDLGQDGLGDLVDAANGEEEKKDEEKKDGDNAGGNGDAAGNSK